MKKELQELRKEMVKEQVDLFLVPMDDYHQSEYVSDYFKTIQYVSGFTGDSCQLAVTETEAKLFTDGRYFIQAEKELAGSGIDLMKLGEKGVPTLTEYLRERLPEKGCLAFDGRCVPDALGSELARVSEKKKAKLNPVLDLVGRIWQRRPELPMHPVWILEEKYSGKSAEEKLRDLRSDVEKCGADLHVITSLDDIAWLLNLRGDDIPCNPVFLSYFLLDRERAYLFANRFDFGEDQRAYLKSLQIELRPYDEIYHVLPELKNRVMLLEREKTNFAILSALDPSVEIVDHMLPTSLRKAVKNETEIRNERAAHIKDGIAVTKLFYFMKHCFDADGKLTEQAKETLGAPVLTECSAADYLERLRRENDGFLELSFPTISAYGENAALPHYAPSRENDTEILNRGLYLVDSGGQYYEGTTDITRTMAMGEITETERRHFTRVAQAMLRVGNAQILHGASGVSFDYAARELFWREGLNYNHGTGHGVGYLLNVHERPNGIRYRLVKERHDSAVFEAGHITSDEPGIYIEGSHGIRLENMTVCVKALENEFGEFLRFEFLTMCPLDLDALDLSLMEAEDIALLNRYHETVYQTLSPYFRGEMLDWLREATREVSK